MQTYDPIGGVRRACWKWIHRKSATWRANPDAWDPFSQLAESEALADVRRFVKAEDYWGAAGTLKRHISGRLQERFFPGACDPRTPAVAADRFPADCERILAEAERLCSGRFDLLGHRDLDFGDPPDWHLDPLTRRRAPLVHGSLYDPADSPVVGNRAIVWELNRHQWLVTLGQAYRFTGQRRFAERFEYTIRDWIAMNPFGMGINWSDSFEVSLRAIAWCWTLALFHQSSVFTADFFTLLLDYIRLHAVYIDRYRSFPGLADRTVTMEGLGLLYVGLLFPELRRASRWRRRGVRILEEQICRQVTEDGVHRAQSTDDQRLTIESYLHAMMLTERNAAPMSHAVRNRIERLLNGLLRLQRPDRTMIHLGNSGPGWLLRLTQRDGDDWRGLLAVAAAWFENRHYAWAAGGRQDEVLWLLGSPGLDRFNGLTPMPPPGKPSAAAAKSGYVQMRSGWDRQAHQLVFDVGPSHVQTQSGHTTLRREQLGIQCSAFGEPMVLDPAPIPSRDDDHWRTFLRGDSQSTVVVDGVAQHLFDDALRRRKWPQTSFRQWSTSERFELAEADHDRFRRLANPVLHRRRVLFVNRAYWLVIDDLQGRGSHRVEVRFHLATELADLDASLLARLWTSEGPGLAIKPLSTALLRAELKQDPALVGVATRGRLPQTPLRLAYSADVTMPFRVVTHLFPLADRQAPIPNPTALLDEHGELSGSVIDHPAETIMFSDRSVTVEAA
ncbi:MAG TPA: alginate lyase family protein [Nitrospira sp.]|nr:alginate lyase family protein [Nitrospira sp.]